MKLIALALLVATSSLTFANEILNSVNLKKGQSAVSCFLTVDHLNHAITADKFYAASGRDYDKEDLTQIIIEQPFEVKSVFTEPTYNTYCALVEKK